MNERKRRRESLADMKAHQGSTDAQSASINELARERLPDLNLNILMFERLLPVSDETKESFEER